MSSRLLDIKILTTKKKTKQKNIPPSKSKLNEGRKLIVKSTSIYMEKPDLPKCSD